jgi:TPR repeat protein
MANRLAEWLDRYWRRRGLPTSKDQASYCYEWDYAQIRRPVSFEDEADRNEEAEACRQFKDDNRTGFPQLLALADRGSVASMEWVAWCCANGIGVARDPIETEIWRRRAFLCGSDFGLLAYGAMLARRGDYRGAEAVYRVGTERDWAPALEYLAYCRLRQSFSWKTLREVRPYLERAAEQGSPGAKRRLARLMSFGLYGLRDMPRGWAFGREFLVGFHVHWGATRAQEATEGAVSFSPPPSPLLH